MEKSIYETGRIISGRGLGFLFKVTEEIICTFSTKEYLRRRIAPVIQEQEEANRQLNKDGEDLRNRVIASKLSSLGNLERVGLKREIIDLNDVETLPSNAGGLSEDKDLDITLNPQLTPKP